MTRGNLLVDTTPAGRWEDAFPVGNGRHGALVPGQPGTEQVIVTHSQLTWPDAPGAPGGPPDTWTAAADWLLVPLLDEAVRARDAKHAPVSIWMKLLGSLPDYRLTAGLLAEMLVDSVPGGEAGHGRVELLPALPAFLPRGLVRGLRTLTGVRVASLRWDAAAGTAEAVLVPAAGGEVDVGCWGSGHVRSVRLRAAVPVRLSWQGNCAWLCEEVVADGDAR
jgi:glycosyl hydrolase family 65